MKFILCTTEPHKVPATIQSRCQRFDFRAIPATQIADHLRTILNDESITADDDVVFHIAQLGNGSMRDALSVLDRLLAAGEKTITDDLLEQMLGLPPQRLVEDLVTAIIDADPSAALTCGAALMDAGVTVEQALELLTERFRTLMVIAACGADQSLIDLSPEALERAGAQAAQFDAPALVHMIALCDQVARNARGSASARAMFDAVLVRLCIAERLADIASLLDGSAPAAPAATTRKKKVSAPPSTREAVAPTPKASPPTPKPAKAAPTSTSRVTEVKPVAARHDHPWECVLIEAKSKPALQAKVEHIELVSWDGNTLKLALRADGASMARWFDAHPQTLPELVAAACGRKIAVHLAMPESRATQVEMSESAKQAALDDPVVRKAADLFDASVIDVRDDERAEDD
ncbi:MAG: hypothetical protein AAF432_16760 [Planctomycetota bacterium]